ncbi:MAG TPA: DUF547 domain-containing protein [Chitinivibrionales bacterium]|jgi:hypothetical protein|nr:DUF547 domain-containing protein [Chitinivibrionales bacterium]
MKLTALFTLSSLSIISITGLAFGSGPLYRDYGALLSEYVCRGGVAYDVLAKNPLALDRAKGELTSLKHADVAALSRNGQIAYYINLYNLYTIDLIVRHLPLTIGIRDIPNPWGVKSIPLFGDTVSLDNIETDILRKQFKDPRIHFALVCASRSCPALQSAPYTGDSLDAQFERAAHNFLLDTTRNTFTNHSMSLSKIFEWYGDDFKKGFGSFSSFLAATLARPVGPEVHFNKYDWSLNKVDKCP